MSQATKRQNYTIDVAEKKCSLSQEGLFITESVAYAGEDNKAQIKLKSNVPRRLDECPNKQNEQSGV